MKTIRIVTVNCFAALLVSGMVFSGCSSSVQKQQNGDSATTDTSQSSGKKAATKLDSNKIPKAVTDAYLKEYPYTAYSNWYGYPTYDDNYWYDSDPYLYTSDYPENYVVEFNKDSMPYKSVYNKTGKKIATHKVSTSDLPQAVAASIDNGEYKTWTLGKEKEEIFKDKDTDQLKVYKVNVEKGLEKHTLFFQQDGQLLKYKKLS